MRSLVLTAFLAAALVPAAALAETDAASSQAGSGYSTADTSLGTLLDNAAAKAVLAKYIPDMIANEQIQMARGMTLQQLQPYASGELTDEKLASIDGELKALPAAN